MENQSENNIIGQKKSTFKKEERLCSKKIIDKLFTEGESFLSFPVKIVFLETPVSSKFPVQAGFSVSKKSFKKAVQRNLIKRRMREAYRLNKYEMYQNIGDKQLTVFFIFIGKTISKYQTIETGIKKGLKKLVKEISTDK